MRLRRVIARAYWAISRYSFRSEYEPSGNAGILVAYPHTSNWDFVYMLAVAWTEGIKLRFLGKKELFRGPLGWLMRACGGVPVDRDNPAGLVEELTQRLKDEEAFFLVVTPEGTRSKTQGWKSGFYRLAVSTGLPVTLAYNDRRTMTIGLGPTLQMTGDAAGDMAKFREFYDGMIGVRPGREGQIRMRGEA